MADEEVELSLIDRLIENQAWGLAEQHFTAHPEAARQPPSHLNPARGWTRLHWLCSMGSTPGSIIGLVASLYPEALVMPDKRFGDTPLHICCRNSVVGAGKVRVLLHHILQQGDPDDILIRNQVGATALHSASNHNAALEVLQALIEANHRIIRTTTHQGVHAVSALWHSYMQTIPGHMCVAQILEGRRVEQAHFERFWTKCVYLTTEFYRRSLDHCPSNLNEEQLRRYVLHGLIQCSVPVNLFRVALRRDPTFAVAVDAQGNTPLHVMLESRPYRLKEREALQALLRAAPAAVVRQSNASQQVPLTIAIRNKIPWKNGLDLVVQADPTVVSQRDSATRLYPFQLAASIGGKVSIETTYHLLMERPDLLHA